MLIRDEFGGECIGFGSLKEEFSELKCDNWYPRRDRWKEPWKKLRHLMAVILVRERNDACLQRRPLVVHLRLHRLASPARHVPRNCEAGPARDDLRLVQQGGEGGAGEEGADERQEAKMTVARKAADEIETAPAIHTINPTAVYSRDTARRILGLRKSTISREIRERRLRVSMRAGRYFILGKWILEWIEAGEKVKDT